MAQFIDVYAKGALDDRQLQSTWDEAHAEYTKYHSLESHGNDWINQLTQRELDEVRHAMGLSPREQISEAEEHDITKWEVVAPLDDKSVKAHVPNVVTQPIEEGAPRDLTTNGPSNPMELPANLAASVQDEETRNLMMSWYYAGYYTGFYDGQKSKAQATI